MNARPFPILLVEDSPDDALLIQRAFRKANLANPVQLVRDGEEAVAYLSGAPPYEDRTRFPLPVFMLLDLKLPRRSGLEVLAWVRQESVVKRLPVVVLTSSRESVDVNRAYDLGVNSYLTKPVGFEALLEMVKNVNLYWLVLNEHPDLRRG
ncbi:MAG TPA: response regulator [Candidatus Deferrimicrobiaceae bacterium]|nr:response regulator [Candidatus Deferrimicrobiaceae bacterium]